MSADDLDPVSVLKVLGVEHPASVTPVSGGWTTAIFRVEHEGKLYALRAYRVGQEETCCREVGVMQAAAAAGIPVPSVQAEGVWRGRPALLLSWCPGHPVAHELRTRPWRAWYMGVLFGRMQAAINRVVVPDALGEPDDAWIGWLGPDEEALRECLYGQGLRSGALLHLDYHLMNVMTDGRRITGVLDWANAHAGDPRADYARTLSILRLDSEPPDEVGVPRWAVRLLVCLFELGWRRGYGRVEGDLAPYNALAGVYLERSLAWRLGLPGGLTRGRLARIRKWTVMWKERAGCRQVQA
ncbi:MAG: phosphotransferase [Chloroflexota bacterium]|nr:phosphotransferase [Chloroflexota bacterium]